MNKNLIVNCSLAVAAGIASVALATTPAVAANGPAPGTGLTGACNMVQAFLPSGGGMATAMSRDAAQGNAGMWHAVDVSGCS